MYESTFEEICKDAEYLSINLSIAELAEFSADERLTLESINAIHDLFRYLQKKQYDSTVEFLLNTSRLPRREPKTFENFDFSRIKGKDSPQVENLKSMAQLYARKNIAFIGSAGVGKTHLAMAYARECCTRGMKSYFIKATELNQRLLKSRKSGNPENVVRNMVKPTCLVIDEIGRCRFDSDNTDLFFDIIDRRALKEGPSTTIFTSNTMPMDWSPFFEKQDSLLCSLDRAFDNASVFIMKGESYRGRKLATYAVEAKSVIVTEK